MIFGLTSVADISSISMKALLFRSKLSDIHSFGNFCYCVNRRTLLCIFLIYVKSYCVFLIEKHSQNFRELILIFFRQPILKILGDVIGIYYRLQLCEYIIHIIDLQAFIVNVHDSFICESSNIGILENDRNRATVVGAYCCHTKPVEL